MKETVRSLLHSHPRPQGGKIKFPQKKIRPIILPKLKNNGLDHGEPTESYY